MRNILFAALIALSATVANADLLKIEAVQPTVANSPAGFTVNDILIDFEGQLFGQQMVVELTAGSIYQDALGGEGPPNPAFFPVAPSLESDSYVTIGGVAPAASDQLIIGASTELGKPGAKQFDDAGANIAWAPAPGVVIDGGVGFPIARLTLSDDAQGSVFMFSNAAGNGIVVDPVGTIVDGVASFIPEPTSAVLVGLALVGFAARRNG